MAPFALITDESFENKKYHPNFSKESKFPSDIHSDKLLPLTESWFI